MKKVTLFIETLGETKTVTLEEETSIGRTDAANIALGDAGLSRVNTTFFRDGDVVFVVDENSLNGTFVNGGKVSDQPQRIFDGDQIKLGTETYIRLEIAESRESREASQNIHNQQSKNKEQRTKDETANPQSAIPNPQSNKPPFVIIAAAGSAFLIILIAAAGIFIASRYESGNGGITKRKPPPKIVASAPIPIRVVDPLGTEEVDSLDDLMAAWEVQDAEFDAKDLQPVTTSTDAPQLAVSVADWETQRNKAMGRRNAPVGLVSGVSVPPELGGDIGKQLAKFREMGITPEKLPRDYVSLAQKRMNNELVELPLATEFYYLDNIGTSADSSPFNVFDISTRSKSPLALGSEGFSILQKLADNYNGQKYDLSNPSDRIQMKRRLLRMFHPKAKPVLEEIAGAYHQKFGRPLKITSLTRSLEYQADLSRATSNAYRGTTPPHSTGMTFDIAYMHMTAEEQNFIMAKFAELERAGRVDALREVGQTPCIHTFVFP